MKMITAILLVFISVLVNAQNLKFNPLKDSLIIKEFNDLNELRTNPKSVLVKELNRKCENIYQYGYDSVKLKAKYGVVKFADLFEYDSLKSTTPVKLDYDMCIKARNLMIKIIEQDIFGHANTSDIIKIGNSENIGGTIIGFMTEGDENSRKGRPHRDDMLGQDYKSVGICVVTNYNTGKNKYWAFSVEELKKKVEKDGYIFNKKLVNTSVRVYMRLYK